MNWLNELFQPAPIRSELTVERLVLALLVAFIVGQFNAWCYKWTHRGVSYSRTFTHALVLISIIAAMSMSLVASNALIAGLAIIRFRNVVRDARDTAYVFLCLTCGIAAGFGYYGSAIIGAVATNMVAIYMHLTSFGAWHTGDGLLRFRIAASALRGDTLEEQLTRFCRRHSMISIDETPGDVPMCQCAYRIRLRDPERGSELVAVLKETFGIDTIHLLIEQEHEDVA